MHKSKDDFIRNFPRTAKLGERLRYLREAGAELICGWDSTEGTGYPGTAYTFLLRVGWKGYVFIQYPEETSSSEDHLGIERARNGHLPNLGSDGIREYLAPADLRRCFREFMATDSEIVRENE